MAKPLSEMDSVYNKIIKQLPNNEKLSYCEQLIDRAQRSLIKNKKFLSEIMEEQLKNIIEAAQLEIKLLGKI